MITCACHHLISHMLLSPQLYNELYIGRFGTTELSVDAINNIKNQLESTYKCLGIT